MMKKKWSLIVAPLVALAVLFSALPTLAQEHTGDAEVVPPPALGIRAPRSVLPDEEMTLVVFDRATEAPVADAGVWAIPLDDPEALRAEITALEGATDADWQSFLDGHGRPLGTTDEDGRLAATFTAEGRYLLVAFKSGYLPGFKPLLVGLPPPALVIRAPRVALPGEEITIGVFDRATEAPVADAGVWAIPLDDPEARRAEITALEGATDADWQSFLDDHGRPLGTTDEDGQLGATFTAEGRYLLVAFKSGYRPAFTPLLVAPPGSGGPPPKALGIDVAHKVVVGEKITITVFDRATREPVEGAGVWAIPRVNSGRLRSELAKLREHGNAVATVAEFAALLGDAAYFGLTDRAGQLTHTFGEAGRYFLVAFKPGSRVAFTPINVLPESGNRGRRPTTDNRRRPTTNNGRRPTGERGRPQLTAARPLPEPALWATEPSLRAAEPARLRMLGQARDLTPAPPRR